MNFQMGNVEPLDDLWFPRRKELQVTETLGGLVQNGGALLSRQTSLTL
jgi:hypothetical protein